MKKVFILFVALIVATTASWATEPSPVANDKGKWGFTDASGAPVVDYIYDAVRPFNGKYAKVCKNNKWGYINASGEEVLKPEYDEIASFKNGVARVMKGKKYGYIDENLKFIVPCNFSEIGSFNDDNLVWVRDGKKYGIYRKDGSIFIEPKYKSIGIFEPYVYEFKEKDFENKSYAYASHYRLNGSSKFYMPKKMEQKPFGKLPESPIGYFYSTDGVHSLKHSVVDPKGNVLVESGKYHSPRYPTQGISVVVKSGSFGSVKYNYLDLSTGKLLLKNDAFGASAFNGDVAYIQTKDGKNLGWDFINKRGFQVSSRMYDKIFPRVNNVYITYKDKKFGMADSMGRVIIEPTFANILSTTGNYFPAQKNEGDKYGLLNNKGEWVVEPKYNAVGVHEKGYITIKQDGKWGALDGDGSEVVKCAWINLKIPSEVNPEIIWVTNEETEGTQRWQPYDVARKKLAFKDKYVDVWNFDQHYPGVAIVNNGENAFGCIGKDGRVIIPLELKNTEMVKAAYKMLQERENGVWRPIDSHRLKLSFDAVNQSYKINQLLDNENWEY